MRAQTKASLCRATAAALMLSLTAWAAHSQQKVVFYTNWYAEAEHGGFYQALAEGTYKANGLDVDVRMGGPQINVMQLLLAEQADLVMGYDLQTIKAVEQHLPVVTVAATFQKDPAILIAHPGVGALSDLKSKTLLIGQANNAANPTLQTVGAQWATPIMIGAPQTAVAFDPTVAQFVEMSSTWSATTGAPTVTLTNFYVFGLN